MSERIPRIEADDLDPAVAEVLGPRIKRLGYLGEFFKCAAHQPRALVAFMELTEALKEALPDRLTEVVALTVAARLDNAYERHQHERLSERLGFGREWIAAVLGAQPDTAPGLGEEERAVQRLVLGVLARGGHGVSAELDAVAGAVGAPQAMAVLMLIGRYTTHAQIVNALGLAPPVPSIFADG